MSLGFWFWVTKIKTKTARACFPNSRHNQPPPIRDRIKSAQEDTKYSLTQIPDAEEMDENIYWLVVVGGIEHKLLLQVKKSSFTCHFLIICKFACLKSIVFLSEMIYLLSLSVHPTSRVQNKQKLAVLMGGYSDQTSKKTGFTS